MNKNKPSYLDPIAIGIAGVVSSNTISLWQKITSSNILVFILSGVTAILVYEIILFVFNKIPKRYSWSRKFVDSRAAYEGFYLEVKNVNDIRTYAIVCLAYNSSIDDYLLSGTSVEQNGMISINWKSNFVKIDTVAKQIVYAQTGHSTDTSDGKMFDGVTYMNFEHFLNGKPLSGTGHYVDTIPAKSDFAFYKISKADCSELLGKNAIESKDDYMLFVKKYHEKKANPIFTWEKNL